MERNPYRSRRGAPARLRVEALEPRALLAVAAFEMNLYQDVGGAPGEAISGAAIEPGDSFFVEITAQEFDPRLSGLRGVALDIAWDPAVLAEIDNPFVPGELITPLLPAFQSGTLDQQAGTIDNLAGGVFLSSETGRAIGGSRAQQFALLHFRALAPAVDSALTMREGRSSIVSVPTATFAAEQLDFERQLITVVGSDSPPGGLQGSIKAEPLTARRSVQVTVRQDSAITSVTSDDAPPVDPTRGFAVDVIVEPASEAAQGDKAAVLDIESLPPFDEVDIAAGEIWLTRQVVQVEDVAVDLPVAIGPIEELVLPLSRVRRIGLAYVPQAHVAATDAVLATTHGDDLLPAAASVHIDHALMQALMCGLASLQKQNTAVEPLLANPV